MHPVPDGHRGRDAAADRADRRRLRGQRGVLRGRPRPGGEPRRRGEPGLDARRSSCSATSASASPRSAPPSGRWPRSKADRVGDRPDRGPADGRAVHRAGERAARARADRAARRRQLRRRQAAPGLVGAQAQGHRAPAGGLRAAGRPRPARWRWPPAPARAPTSPTGRASPTPTYLNLRKASIYGGSNEIQRQIIAGTILGL